MFFRLTLVTQRPLPGSPLEALNDAVFDRAQQRLVHLQKKTRQVLTVAMVTWHRQYACLVFLTYGVKSYSDTISRRKLLDPKD